MRLTGFLLLASIVGAQAGNRPKPLKTAAVEARNETAAPSLSRHMRDARRITIFLEDALLLSTAQRYAVARCTVAERRALVLAVTEADFRQAQGQYLKALHKVLALSQLNAYVALCQQLAGTTLPLDGTELAVR
ncbi:hypothetical protein [Hymenobacter antarcticus]|uniref:Uncharacterized protein n=1 Tax=Hymenobacter antarcticus TaxID=486270 RepID=A0ABP7P0M1_9BACT